MIDGLDDLLRGPDGSGLAELRSLLEELLGEAAGAPVDAQELRRARVFRLRYRLDGGSRSVVVKRHSPNKAGRDRVVARRLLPAVGLGRHGPPLLGVASVRQGTSVWHVYEDLGDCALDRTAGGGDRVAAALEVIAEVHTRFADHALLWEGRIRGGDRGAHFLGSCARDALRSVSRLGESGVVSTGEREAVRTRLIDHLCALRDEAPRRARAVAELGGPETLLHGDLWTSNVLVGDAADRSSVRLIDWDHLAVGPVSYDLSTLLLRFPLEDRVWVLERYADAVRPRGWRLPAPGELNLLFDTMERARIASCVPGPANAAAETGAAWAFDQLADVADWFDALEPVLPV